MKKQKEGSMTENDWGLLYIGWSGKVSLRVWCFAGDLKRRNKPGTGVGEDYFRQDQQVQRT